MVVLYVISSLLELKKQVLYEGVQYMEAASLKLYEIDPLGLKS